MLKFNPCMYAFMHTLQRHSYRGNSANRTQVRKSDNPHQMIKNKTLKLQNLKMERARYPRLIK
jgi:hypothetical protein